MNDTQAEVGKVTKEVEVVNDVEMTSEMKIAKGYQEMAAKFGVMLMSEV